MLTGRNAESAKLSSANEELKAEELLARVADGDVEALGSLHDKFAPRLMGLLMRILSVKTDAESTLQEVFLRLWKGAPGIVQARGSLAAWLVFMARHIASQRLRAQRAGGARIAPSSHEQARRKEEKPLGKPVDSTLEGDKTWKRRSTKRDSVVLSFLTAFPHAWMPRPEDIALVDVRLPLLQRAFNQIPKEQRHALELAVFGGYTEAEIAEQLGEPLGKVKAGLRATFTFLRHRQRAVLGTWTADI
jgi:RNA polymerase sigma-70 factor (ECF subfamily)